MKTFPLSPRITVLVLMLIVAVSGLLTLAGCGEEAKMQKRLVSLEKKVTAMVDKMDQLSEQNHKLQIELMALKSGQKPGGKMPGLVRADLATTPLEQVLSELREKEVRNTVLFELKEEEFVPSFMQVMGTQYVGQLNDLSEKRMQLEVALKGLINSGAEDTNSQVIQVKSALDLVNDRLLEEITQQKRAMEVEVQILREQVDAIKEMKEGEK